MSLAAEPGQGEIEAWGREVVRREAEALAGLAPRVGPVFAGAVVAVRRCVEAGGKVIVTGIGKSGLVARRIAATFNSLGTTSSFLHPAEARHGDLGVARPGDLVVAVSRSGETPELLALLPAFRRLALPLVAITGSPGSSLAREADWVLDAAVSGEACALDLAPTASCAAQAALGDAMAVAVSQLRGITREEFALSHPGGALGRRLLLKVRDVMHRGAEVPVVREEETLSAAILEIVRKRLGMTAVVDRAGRLTGIITDGDLKRILVRHRDAMDLPVREVMTREPRTIEADVPLERALLRMEENPERLITSLLILNPAGEPEGVIHMHDILRAGVG